MSNAERQRRFRERNPGYYGRWHARRRALIKANLAAAKLAAMAQSTVARREPLLLPAPVEVLEIPGLNAIPATLPARSANPVAREATRW
jgi:hypothetical protein